jgi:hypothetical protein
VAIARVRTAAMPTIDVMLIFIEILLSKLVDHRLLSGVVPSMLMLIQLNRKARANLPMGLSHAILTL